MKLNWKEYSRYRLDLFGVAIILIMILHGLQDSGNNNLSIMYQSIIGSIGVEIFAFLSGMGLFFSLKRNNNKKLFYKKRVFRILPEYFLIAGVTFGIHDFIFNKGSFFKDLLFISFFGNGMRLYWYIIFILIMYVIYPFFFNIFNSNKKNNTIVCWSLIIIWMVMLVVLKKYNFDLYDNIYIMLNRVPVFILGSYYGKKIYDGVDVNKDDWILIISGTFIKIYTILNLPMSNLLPLTVVQLLFIVPLIWIIIYVLNMIKKTKYLQLLGSISLELYIIHVSVRLLFQDANLDTGSMVIYFCVIIISFILSLLIYTVKRRINS